MALKSTIYKAHLQISDLDRHYYAEHPLTLAQHPSETELRLMVRVLAFALYADEALHFTKGLCVDDEPDLWRRSLTDEIELWIDVGLPTEKRIRKACGRSQQVVILVYGSDAQVDPWWKGIRSDLRRFDNLHVRRLSPEQGEALTALAARQMMLQCTVQDAVVWLTSNLGSAEVDLITLDPLAND